MVLDLPGGLFEQRDVRETALREVRENISKSLAVDTYTIQHDFAAPNSLFNIFDESLTTYVNWSYNDSHATKTTTLILDVGKATDVFSTLISFNLSLAGTLGANNAASFTTSHSLDKSSWTQIAQTTKGHAAYDDAYDHSLALTTYRYLRLVYVTTGTGGGNRTCRLKLQQVSLFK